MTIREAIETFETSLRVSDESFDAITGPYVAKASTFSKSLPNAIRMMLGIMENGLSCVVLGNAQKEDALGVVSGGPMAFLLTWKGNTLPLLALAIFVK